MGYAPHYFTGNVAHWLDQGWLPAGGRLIDFGAQELDGDRDASAADIRVFLNARGRAIGAPPTVAAVYGAIGIDYTAIDVDLAHGSTYFDLNTFRPPPAWVGAFDFVNNEGTIEHLVNPINGFQVAHELAKTGGVIRHSMPLMGWKDHGFFYPTTKFYALLVAANRYEVLEAKAELQTRHHVFDDPLFTAGGGTTEITDIWARLIYRRVHRAPFAVPADHLTGPDAAAIAAVLAASMSRYAAHRPLSRAKADVTMARVAQAVRRASTWFPYPAARRLAARCLAARRRTET